MAGKIKQVTDPTGVYEDKRQTADASDGACRNEGALGGYEI
jgi:hypothetical protein